MTTSQTRRLVESAVDTYDSEQDVLRRRRGRRRRARPARARGRRHRGRVRVRPARQHRHGPGRPRDRRRGRRDRGVRRRRRHLDRRQLGGVLPGLGQRGVRRPRPLGASPATTTTASFVHDYLRDHGWTMLDGEVVDGPGGTSLLGVDDPRSSGLGNWRDETGLTFAEVERAAGRRRLRGRRAG